MITFLEDESADHPQPLEIESMNIQIPPTQELTEDEVCARKIGNELPILSYKENILSEIEVLFAIIKQL